MRMRRWKVLVTIVGCSIAVLTAGPLPAPAAVEGTWAWPATGPLTALFDPPLSTYGSGHRGLDIAMVPGTALLAPAPGVVSFAGPVAGNRFVTIDHGDGLESTYSWLSEILVRVGDRVRVGDPIARSGGGHPGGDMPSLHLGVRLDGEYVDPLDYLGPFSVSDFIRLAPFVGSHREPAGEEPRAEPAVGDGWLVGLRAARSA